MATQITNYQCPACTGPLHFVGESGRLECDYCGSSFDIAEIEASMRKKKRKQRKRRRSREKRKRLKNLPKRKNNRLPQTALTGMLPV